MKLLKITTVYQAYWSKFYSKHPGLANQPYATQKEALDYDGFGWADFWSHALMPLGYEVMEIIANIEPLQKAWALENSVIFTEENWLLEIVSAQVKRFQPAVLFPDDFYIFTADWLVALKQACPSISLTVGWCGAPYQDVSIFRAHDLVLSCIPEFVEKFRNAGHWSEHINHAFEPRLLKRLPQIADPEIDISFIGQIVRSNHYHLQRKLILEQLVEQFPVQVYSPTSDVSWKAELKHQLKISAQRLLTVFRHKGIPESWLRKVPKIGKLAGSTEQVSLNLSQQLRHAIRPAVFGLQMYQTLQNSKITFNSHIDVSPYSASNMRLFEATGSGTCLLTDWKKNIQTVFEPDYEVVTYKSIEECIEKVRWLLENPEKRKAIAQAGQNRTLENHTFIQRAIQLDKLIKEGLQKKR